MKTLIIYANPKEKGHCRAVLEEVEANLESESYEVLDLYHMNFDPVLKKEDFTEDGHIKTSEYSKPIQNKITACDRLIFIYPHWWGGMPAILKGFFERVFTEGFALKFEGKMPKPLLKGKQALVFKTTGGPTFFHLFFGNRDSNIIKKEILKFSGIKTKVVQIGMCSKLDDKKRLQIKRMVKKALISENE